MKIVVVGAGMIGLCSAMLLANDGHEVVVLERDTDAPPDPSVAWEKWERRGVNQFRLAHFYLCRFRSVIEAELPQLATNMTAAGALRFNVFAGMPDEMKGGSRPGDDVYDALTGRRTVVEAVASQTCESTPRVTIRRGAPVGGLLTGTSARDSVPHVTGVKLEDGEEIGADLVIDASGRRSPLPKWLADLGARPVAEVLEDSGFMYYGRHFRSEDGTIPPMIGPAKQDYGSISVLTLPADNGTWSVTLITSAKDTAMRATMDPDKWAAVVRSLPLAAHWLDGTPIDDRVQVIAKIEDRVRDFAPGGQPVTTGVLTVADSWACTNPSLGRGISIGSVHAVALRDLLRQSGADPWQQALDWADTTRETVQPWYDTTLRYDRNRLNEIDALIEGRPYESDDPEWQLIRDMEKTSTMDGDIIRAGIDMTMVRRLPKDVLGDRALLQKLSACLASVEDAPPLGPDRSQLLALLNS
jgi:2-polyprenyl-6-methoxyphenol hydroxylase-like FAD-dependent oxidoreductase